MPTVNQVVQSAMQELSLVAGLSTQQYATPRLRKFVEDAFFLMFDDEDHYWNRFIERVDLAVANGLLTENVVGALGIIITDYRDILAVWPDGSSKQLVDLGFLTNASTLTGSTARYKAPSNTVSGRPFRIYPTGFTGTVQALVRSRLPQPFDDAQELYLDKTALAKGTAFMYLASTGTNAGHAASLQAQFVSRVNQVKLQENTVTIAKDPRLSYDSTDEWFEMP